jgi:hypothetical protein
LENIDSGQNPRPERWCVPPSRKRRVKTSCGNKQKKTNKKNKEPSLHESNKTFLIVSMTEPEMINDPPRNKNVVQ